MSAIPICKDCIHKVFIEDTMFCKRTGESWEKVHPVKGTVSFEHSYEWCNIEREMSRCFLPTWFPRMPWRCGAKGAYFEPKA